MSQAGLDPLIRFHAYQRAWKNDDSRFKIGMFARQTGKTFTTSAEIVDDCARAELAGQRTRWVILSRGERQASECMNEAVKPFTKALWEIYKGLNPTFDEREIRGDSGATYRALDVSWPGGSRITALPANPDTARGFSANVFLDEFAFHKDSRAIWGALFPVVSKRGLKLRITSTPNGKNNKFYELMTGNDPVWSRHTVDIYRAVKEGLDRDVDELRAGIADADLWSQEYELHWLDEASAWLPYETIFAVEDGRAGDPAGYQGGPCFIGNDIAAGGGDLWVAWVWEQVGDVLWCREVRELKRAKFATHDAVMDELFGRYKVVRLCMDQTGMGEKPVEDAKRRYGDLRAQGILFTGPNKLVLATQGKTAFDDRKVRIPAGSPALRADLHSLVKQVSETGAVRFVAPRTGGSHADRTWAAFLGIHAAGLGAVEYGYTPAAAPEPAGPVSDDADDWRATRLRFSRGAF